jgi:hypothetical protein
VFRDWAVTDHRKHSDSLSGLRQAKALCQGNKGALRDQLWWVVGLLMGHFHLEGHIFKLGIVNSPICERCLEKEESATNILCDCEVMAFLRFCHIGHYFMEPSDNHDKDSPALHQKCRIDRGMNEKGKHNSCWWLLCRGQMNLHACMHAYIHTDRQTLSKEPNRVGVSHPWRQQQIHFF